MAGGGRSPRAAREWLAFVMGLMTAGITCGLSVSSQDPLAPAYLVSLFLVVLFNGGVIRMRFWMAVQLTMLVMAIFALGASMAPGSAMSILMSSALVLVSSAVFRCSAATAASMTSVPTG